MVSFGAEGSVGVASDRGDLVAMYRVIFKSLLDRTGAAAALLLLAPLMVAIGLAIGLFLGRPILFRQ